MKLYFQNRSEVCTLNDNPFQASGDSQSLSILYDSTEKAKGYKYDAFALERGASFVPLVMEANGGLSKCAQKILTRKYCAMR